MKRRTAAKVCAAGEHSGSGLISRQSHIARGRKNLRQHPQLQVLSRLTEVDARRTRAFHQRRAGFVFGFFRKAAPSRPQEGRKNSRNLLAVPSREKSGFANRELRADRLAVEPDIVQAPKRGFRLRQANFIHHRGRRV